VLSISKECQNDQEHDKELDMTWLKSVPEIKEALYTFAEQLYPAIHLASLDQDDSLLEDLGSWINIMYRVSTAGEFIYSTESESCSEAYKELTHRISLIMEHSK
jgi:hypothetical protein